MVIKPTVNQKTIKPCQSTYSGQCATSILVKTRLTSGYMLRRELLFQGISQATNNNAAG